MRRPAAKSPALVVSNVAPWLVRRGLLAPAEVATASWLPTRVLVFHDAPVVCESPLPAAGGGRGGGGRVLEIVLDRLPECPPPGFLAAPVGLEVDLGGGTVEAALALCRAHRLAVRASRVWREIAPR